MLRARLPWQSKTQEARLHSRLAFFAQLQRFYYLPLLVGLHGITDTINTKVGQWRKDVLEGHAPFCFNFSAKDVCTINFTGFFAFICRVEPRYLKLG